MESLKTAVSFLVSVLNKADPTYTASGSELVRTGAIAYEASPFAAQSMSWGTSSVNTYVGKIPQYPTGGTDATKALTTAYDALKSPMLQRQNSIKTRVMSPSSATSFS